MHGKVGSVRQIADDPLLDDLPEPFEAGRYHSLAALPPLPDDLEVTAVDATARSWPSATGSSPSCTACSSTPSRS